MSKAAQKPLYNKYLKRVVKVSMLGVLSMYLFILLILKISKTKLIINPNLSYNSKIRTDIRKAYAFYEEGTRQLSGNHNLIKYVKDKDSEEDIENIISSLKYCDIDIYYTIIDKSYNILKSNLSDESIVNYCEDKIILKSLEKINNNPRTVISVKSNMVTNKNQKIAYHYIAHIGVDDDIDGYLTINISYDSIQKYLGDMPVDKVLITDSKGNIIYSTEGESGVYNIENEDEKQYYITKGAAGFGINVYTISSIKLYRQLYKVILINTTILTIFIVILLIIFGNRVGKTSIKELVTINNLIQSYQGDQNIIYKEKVKFSEFQTLYDEINRMVKKMKQLSLNNTELEQRKHWMEISHLTSQFNPHFVFNIMETLKYVIVIDPHKASKMVVEFASLMRYCINYGRTEVALKTDIDYIETYLRLQKTRYTDRLNYNIDIDDQIMDSRIPKLLIQPLVENSIIHNLESTLDLEVNIKGTLYKGNIILEVRDNGKGITPKKLDQLQKTIDSKEGTSSRIGLYNVHRTIQLVYGQQYGIKISSIYNEGTSIVATMPYKGLI